MFSVNQSLLYGKEISSDRHISAGVMFKKLAGKGDDGKVPVYSKFSCSLCYNQKDLEV